MELVHKEKKKKNAWGVGGMGRRERRVLKKRGYYDLISFYLLAFGGVGRGF